MSTPTVALCNWCNAPIRTRWRIEYWLQSAEASYRIVLCSICWGTIVPADANRKLNRLADQHPIPSLLLDMP